MRDSGESLTASLTQSKQNKQPRPLTWGFGARREGFEPPTARSVAWCSASVWSAPDGSGLLTLDASSVQTAPDGYRRIVWMIKTDDQASTRAGSPVSGSGERLRPPLTPSPEPRRGAGAAAPALISRIGAIRWWPTRCRCCRRSLGSRPAARAPAARVRRQLARPPDTAEPPD